MRVNAFENKQLALPAVIFFLVVTAVSQASAGEDFPHTYDLSNGIRVNIYTPQTVLESMTGRDISGNLLFIVPGGNSYELIEEIEDPLICNKGDGSFHPMREEEVLSALEEIRVGQQWLNIEVEIYILPMPRRYVPCSSTEGTKIFLSPGVIEIGYNLTAFTVSHELGHCVNNIFLPDPESGEWLEYLAIRGISDSPVFCAEASHAYRPREIFAEDFRYLFGGEASNYSGTIENPYLELPDMVEGLEEYFVSVVSISIASRDSGETPFGKTILSSSNYPNPFNPSTTISILLAEDAIGKKFDLSIYSAGGRLVRHLAGGVAESREIRMTWDGKTDNGSVAGSGVYFYAIRSGSERGTGKMILVR